MKRINVVGTSGSGKSTFARELAHLLQFDYVEMDELYWKDNWVESNDEELTLAIEKALNKEKWVLDGNYNRMQSIKWKKIDTLIWLDYPFYIVFFRVVKRALIRSVTRKKLWNTNNFETFSKLFSKNSIVLWMITSYPQMKKRYLAIFENSNILPNVKKIRLTSPQMAKRFLEEMKK